MNYDPVELRDWMVANPWVPAVAVLMYGVFIVLGKKYFTGRPAWDWRATMALWNLFLSVFSAIGFCRTLPQLVHDFYYYSVTENFCFDPESSYGSGSSGLWVQLFCLSKFPYVVTPHMSRIDLLHALRKTMHSYKILFVPPLKIA